MSRLQGGAWVVMAAAVLVAGFAGPVSADVLNMGGTRNADGSWTGLASLETVPVGNPGNAGDMRYPDTYYGASDFGSVGYTYNIGKYEVTAGQYCEFLNKVAGVDTNGLYNASMWSDDHGCKIERYAGAGTIANPYQYRVAADWANRPVNYVSYGDACRFANWLHNSQPSGLQDSATTEDGAYYLNGAANVEVVTTVARKASWKWAVTSEDEWYKAAYYNPTTGSYYDYPTRSNSLPRNSLLTPDGGNNANFNYDYTGYTIGSPYYRTPVGEFELSDSPYGTFDQGGNVFEWDEAVIGSSRGVRGGSFGGVNGGALRASSRFFFGNPPPEGYDVGFRVVQVPEPATLAVLAVGSLLIARRRRV